MPQKRMISSELFTSADLLDLPAMARLLFAGLICNADDEGIGRAETDYLRAKILPGLRANRAQVEQYLEVFEQRDMITVRRLNGVVSYICSNWHRYQKLSRPRKSKYPVPPEGNRTEVNRIEDEVKASAAENKPDRMGQSADSPELSGSSGPLPYGRASAPQTEAQVILVDEIARGFCIGYAKAGICVYELGVDDKDWKAWQAYEKANGTKLAVMNIQRYRSPSEIPQLKPGQEQKSFREKDKDAAKADAQRLRKRGTQ